MYEHLMDKDGFTPLRQREALIQSVRPICFGCAGVDGAAAGRDAQQDITMRHLEYVFLHKLKQPIFNNTVYGKEDVNVLSYPSLRALCSQLDDQLPFIFAEMEDVVMEKLNIQTLVPPPLEIMNLVYAETTSVGYVTPVPVKVQDISTTLGASYLNYQSA